MSGGRGLGGEADPFINLAPMLDDQEDPFFSSWRRRGEGRSRRGRRAGPRAPAAGQRRPAIPPPAMAAADRSRSRSPGGFEAAGAVCDYEEDLRTVARPIAIELDDDGCGHHALFAIPDLCLGEDGSYVGIKDSSSPSSLEGMIRREGSLRREEVLWPLMMGREGPLRREEVL